MQSDPLTRGSLCYHTFNTAIIISPPMIPFKIAYERSNPEMPESNDVKSTSDTT